MRPRPPSDVAAPGPAQKRLDTNSPVGQIHFNSGIDRGGTPSQSDADARLARAIDNVDAPRAAYGEAYGRLRAARETRWRDHSLLELALGVIRVGPAATFNAETVAPAKAEVNSTWREYKAAVRDFAVEFQPRYEAALASRAQWARSSSIAGELRAVLAGTDVFHHGTGELLDLACRLSGKSAAEVHDAYRSFGTSIEFTPRAILTLAHVLYGTPVADLAAMFRSNMAIEFDPRAILVLAHVSSGLPLRGLFRSFEANAGMVDFDTRALSILQAAVAYTAKNPVKR